MLSIDINHPDVEKFATIKSDKTKVTGANISIRLNREFMQAVKEDKDYILRWPCDFEVDIEDEEFLEKRNYKTLYNFRDGYIKKIKAKELWNTIVEQAKDNAEPGLMFWDNMLDNSPDAVYPEFIPISSNPCGEQFLQAYDSCRLMCLNLFSVVDNPFTDKAEINFDRLYKLSYEQQRLMDNLVDLEIEHIERIIEKIESDSEPDEIKQTELNLWKNIRNTAKAGRRTGSGITALADMLAAIGLKYDSDEALKVVGKVMHTKMEAELDCTIDLAILRGSFKGWDVNLEMNADGAAIKNYGNNFYKLIREEFPNQATRMQKFGRRNISWSTIAPTGSTSIMAKLIDNCNSSSGCEPLFMPFYMRRKKVNPSDEDSRVDFVDQNGDSWQEYPVLMGGFKDWIQTNYIDIIDNDITDVSKLSKERLNELYQESPYYKATANDIDWRKRLEIQSVLQKYTTNAISSTLNLREDISLEEVKDIYEAGYDLNLKGVTIYVEGSRSGVLVDSSKKDKDEFIQLDAPKRPDYLECDIHHLTAKGNKWTVLIGLFDDKPYEVFALEGTIAGNYNKGTLSKKASGKYNLNISNDEDVTIHPNITEGMTDEEKVITRLLSTALRHGAKPQFLFEQLEKGDGTIISFTKALARTIKKYISEDDLVERAKCSDCKSTDLRFEEGCLKCNNCGSSKCS